MRIGTSLEGRRVLVTASEPDRYRAALEAAGARPACVPTIETRCVGGGLDRVIGALDGFDWCVFTSANGVRCILDRARELDVEIPAELRFAVVGPRTGRELEERGFAVSAMPERHEGAMIPDTLEPVAGRRVLLARAAAGGDDLPSILTERGAIVADVVAYETIEGPEAARATLRAELEPPPDAIVFTSGSTVRGFQRLAGASDALRDAVVACLGPTAIEAARKAGVRKAVMAAERTPKGIVDILEQEFGARVG